MAKLTWTTAKPTDVENFVAYLAKETVRAHTISRKISCLATILQMGQTQQQG